MGRVSIIVDNQVRMPAAAAEPALDLFAILLDCSPDCTFSRFPIGPGGSGSNVAFVAQAPAEFVIRPANVLAKRMAPGSLILREVTNGTSSCVSLFLRG